VSVVQIHFSCREVFEFFSCTVGLFILFEWEDDGTHSVMSADKVNNGDRLQKGDSIYVKLPEGNFKGTVITLGKLCITW